MMRDDSSNEFVDLDVSFHVRVGVGVKGAKSDVLYIQIYLLGCALQTVPCCNMIIVHGCTQVYFAS
jgi:hypothetical protein